MFKTIKPEELQLLHERKFFFTFYDTGFTELVLNLIIFEFFIS